MRRAIKREEFRLHYQPIVSLVTGRIIGFEALIRWHAQRGLLQSSSFPQRKTGMIISIGQWVLRKHVIDAHSAQFPQHTPLMISVNFPAARCGSDQSTKFCLYWLGRTQFEAGDYWRSYR